MPLFKILRDYRGWKAGAIITLCSSDHLEAMRNGAGEEYTPPPPKPKVEVKIETINTATPKLGEAQEALKAIKKPEVKKEELKPAQKKEPVKTQKFNTRSQKKKGAGKKHK